MQQHNTSDKNSPGITNKGFSGVLKLYYCPHSETKILLVQHSKHIVPNWFQSLKVTLQTCKTSNYNILVISPKTL